MTATEVLGSGLPGTTDDSSTDVLLYDESSLLTSTAGEEDAFLSDKSYSDASGSGGVVDVEDLPTFYASRRLGPLTALMAMALGISGPVNTEFLKLRVCEVALNITANICASINEPQYKSQADLVVKETAHYTLYSSLVSSLPPVIFSIFIGAWSDVNGRKLAMLVPLVGYFLSAVYMSVITNFTLSPNYLLIPPIFSSLSGGWTVLLMAKYSFLGDCTTTKSRAMNIAIIDGIMVLVSNLSGLLGGFLFAQYGVQLVFYVVTGVHAGSFLYVLLVIRDRISRPKTVVVVSGCSQLFSLEHLRENWRTLRRQRTGHTRRHIYILLISLELYMVCTLGDSSVTQLFLEFQPFRWDVQFYTLFNCIKGICSSVSLVGCMILFRKYLHLPDTFIGFIAALSGVLYFFGYGIAQVDWMIYVFSAVGFLKYMITACIRSLLCAFVDKNEMGKVMSVISSFESLTPLFGSIIFTTLFAETSSWYPGLCFIVAAFLSVPVMAAFGYVDVVRRGDIYQGAKT